MKKSKIKNQNCNSKFKIFGFWIVILIFTFCILNFIGCAGMAKKDKEIASQSLLEPQGTLKFSDVPVPVGFRILPQESYSFESSGVRVGVLKYRGKANPDQVIGFYREQMPLYNWHLLNIVEYGERLLNFERENESCIISLLPKGNLVTLVISLGPKSQGPKRSKEPIK